MRPVGDHVVEGDDGRGTRLESDDVGGNSPSCIDHVKVGNVDDALPVLDHDDVAGADIVALDGETEFLHSVDAAVGDERVRDIGNPLVAKVAQVRDGHVHGGVMIQIDGPQSRQIEVVAAGVDGHDRYVLPCAVIQSAGRVHRRNSNDPAHADVGEPVHKIGFGVRAAHGVAHVNTVASPGCLLLDGESQFPAVGIDDARDDQRDGISAPGLELSRYPVGTELQLRNRFFDAQPGLVTQSLEMRVM